MKKKSMSGKACCSRTVFWVFVLLLFSQATWADIMNGDFATDLSGWTADPTVSWNSGVAEMDEDSSFLIVSLTQTFTIPANSASLSFEYEPLFANNSLAQDSFSVSLLDPSTFNPLIPTDADPTDPSETYFFLHDWDPFSGIDDKLYDPSYSTVTDIGSGWNRVTLDLMSLGGTATPAFLAFDLLAGPFDLDLSSVINVDNVAIATGITPIPTPSAVLLAFLGLGVAAQRLRKTKSIG